jgi:hypothetical protein
MHKPGHLREAFQDYLDSDLSACEFTMDDAGEERTPDWLLGQLWNCTDVLPAGYCDQLDLPKGSTYAQAVRHLKVRQQSNR